MLSYTDIERYVQLTANWTLEFWEQFQDDWLTNRVLPAAKRNPLYEGVDSIRDIRDLEGYASVDWDDIDRMGEKLGSLDKLITGRPAASWYSSGSSGRRKTVWASEEDLDMCRRVYGRRLYNMGIGHKARVLLLVAPEGYSSAVYPRLSLNWLAETVYVPFTQMGQYADKLLSGRYDVMVTLAPVAYLLATKDGSKRLTGMVEKIPVISDLAAEVKHRKLKEVFRGCQVLIGGDFRTDHQDRVLTDFYERPTCVTYASTEVITAGAECLDRNGRYHTGEMHPAFDDAIPLIIPMSEMEKERLNPKYEPRKMLLSRAPNGTIGEAVFTVNSDCFVRINYRTGDIIRKGRDKSDCPTPLPTFEILGRVSRKVQEPALGLEGYEGSLVKIAAAPFCVKHMREALSWVRQEGKVKDWYSTLRYVRGKPCLTLFIEIEDGGNTARVKEEIMQRIGEHSELFPFVVTMKSGMAELHIEFIQKGTLDKVKEEKLRALSAGNTGLGQLKIPKLVLSTDYYHEQRLFG